MSAVLDPQVPAAPLEHFHVVLLKQGVAEQDAKMDDFKRVPVEAADPLAAMQHDDVDKEVTGYRVLMATKPGIKTEPEIMAYRRTVELAPLDRSKI